MNITQSFVHEGIKYRATPIDCVIPNSHAVLAKIEGEDSYLHITSKGQTKLLSCWNTRKTTSSGNVYYLVAYLNESLAIVRQYGKNSPEPGKWNYIDVDELETWEESYFHALEVPTYNSFKPMHKYIKDFGYDSFADFKQMCRDLSKKNIKLYCAVYQLTRMLSLRITLDSTNPKHLGYPTVAALREAWFATTGGTVEMYYGKIRLEAVHNESHYLNS